MKKFFAAILLITYFTVSTGFTISLHYCMDRLAAVELGADHWTTCHKCGMNKKGGDCCKDEIKTIKLQQDQIGATYAIAQFCCAAPVSDINIYHNSLIADVSSYEQYVTHSPPLISKQDIYLHNRVFRL